MKSVVKVGFSEQSKAVVAEASITIEGEEDMHLIAEEALRKAQELFDKAFTYSQQKTLKKI